MTTASQHRLASLEAVIWEQAPGLNSTMPASRKAAMSAVLSAISSYLAIEVNDIVTSPERFAARQRLALAVTETRGSENAH